MRSFTTTDGQSWAVRLDFGTIQTVKATCDLDMLDVAENGVANTVNALQIDIRKLVEVAYCVCEKQIIERGQEDTFHEIIDAETLRNIRVAIMESWSDFFLQAGNPALADLLEQQQKTTTEMLQHTAERMRGMDFNQELKSSIDSMLSDLEKELKSPSGEQPAL